MKLENANRQAMSKILAKLRKNENNIGVLIPEIGQHLKSSGERHTVADALRWAENMLGKSSKIEPICGDEHEEKSLSIKSIQPIKNVSLTDYLKEYKIPISTAAKYANQAWVFNHKTQRSFIAFTYKNESGSDEIINRHISGASTKPDIMFIRGKIYKPKGLHIFKNILDFFALLSHKKVDALDEDSIILTSWSNLSKATPYIKGYGYRYVCCWLENTVIGNAATRSIYDFIKSETGTRFLNMVSVYKEHISLFNWHLNYSDNPSS